MTKAMTKIMSWFSAIKPKILVKKIHQWLALLIGLQLLLWLITGLSFGLLDAAKVSGNSLLDKPAKTLWQGEPSDFKKILLSQPKLRSIESGELLAAPIYIIRSTDKTTLLDAENLQPIAVNQELIDRVARQVYAGSGALTDINLVHQRLDENRDFDLPVWQVTFNDSENSALYIDAKTAKVLKLKTDTWRLFDILWMLHIMDYSGMSDFNNSLVIFAALLLCFFVLSGIFLIFLVFSRQDFARLYPFKAQTKIQLQVISKDKSHYQFEVKPNQRLIDVLAEQKILLPSTCGGGGECGRCWIKAQDELPISDEEANLFNPSQLKKGIRLACQQRLTSDISISIATVNATVNATE